MDDSTLRFLIPFDTSRAGKRRYVGSGYSGSVIDEPLRITAGQLAAMRAVVESANLTCAERAALERAAFAKPTHQSMAAFARSFPDCCYQRTNQFTCEHPQHPLKTAVSKIIMTLYSGRRSR